MAGINKGLKVDDRVVIVETTDDRLDGTEGTVLGTSFDYIMKAHIVLLDKPYNGEKAISITEACLEKVSVPGLLDLRLPYETNGGTPGNAEFVRQNGVVFSWSEINMRYELAWWLDPSIQVTPLVEALRRDHSPLDEPWVTVSYD